MKTNITISQDTRRAKADGSFPIILRLGHHGKTTSILTGHSVLEKEWDAKNKLIKKSYQGSGSVVRINNIIQKQRADAMAAIVKLEENGELQNLTVVQLRNMLFKDHSSNSFTNFTKKIIQELFTAHRTGTARSYQGVLSVLMKFFKKEDIQFTEISYSFLIKFEVQHKANGNGTNGLAVYFRTIRAIYNRAIKEGLVSKESYPFAEYKIKTIPTVKRALDWNFLQKIIALELEPTHPCFKARNYFLASYMLYGMNYTDMAFLQKSNIVQGRIKYRRRKTSKLYDIKISGALEKILNYYIDQDKESHYVFPIIKSENAIEQEKNILWSRKRYNKQLKALATLCGIEQNLTSYVSRHSFATQAMMKDVPLQAISSMLGHSSIKTTEIYLKSLPSNILDDYNQRILQYM